jgi:hypothetical protein
MRHRRATDSGPDGDEGLGRGLEHLGSALTRRLAFQLRPTKIAVTRHGGEGAEVPEVVSLHCSIL